MFKLMSGQGQTLTSFWIKKYGNFGNETAGASIAVSVYVSY